MGKISGGSSIGPRARQRRAGRPWGPKADVCRPSTRIDSELDSARTRQWRSPCGPDHRMACVSGSGGTARRRRPFCGRPLVIAQLLGRRRRGAGKAAAARRAPGDVGARGDSAPGEQVTALRRKRIRGLIWHFDSKGALLRARKPQVGHWLAAMPVTRNTGRET